jgi:hypothetical protein
MTTMLQQELKPGLTPDDEDELYDEEPRRHSWGAIMSVVLALALGFVGYQWYQSAGRERDLATQVGSLRAEVETQRLRAEDAQRQAGELGRRLAGLGAERDALSERVAALEKAARSRATAARDARTERATAARDGGGKARATPVSSTRAAATKKAR